MTLPIWVLEVVAFAAIALIWLAVLLCIVDAVEKAVKRRRQKRVLDLLWEDSPEPISVELLRANAAAILRRDRDWWKVRRP